MHLDVQTLCVVTVFITALLRELLVFAGLQTSSIRAPRRHDCFIGPTSTAATASRRKCQSRRCGLELAVSRADHPGRIAAPPRRNRLAGGGALRHEAAARSQL